MVILILFSWNFLNAQNSWVQFTVQYDFYAPQESNFMFVSNANGDTLLYHAPTTTYETLDTVINCDAGDYVITLSDSYGDGWLSNQPASFKMHNLCQGMIMMNTSCFNLWSALLSAIHLYSSVFFGSAGRIPSVLLIFSL